MFVTLLVACLAALAAARAPPGKPSYDLSDAPNIYKEFVQKHSKIYDADEYNKRFEIFKESLRRVNELNEKYDHTTFDIYHFADLTQEEMRNYMGFKYSPGASAPAPQLRDVTPPAAFDWREKQVVTPVKNQAGCGSCFIFSAIGNIESQYAIKHKQCISLSEQQVLDCTHTGDCILGGDMCKVMQALARDEAGCMKESDYPYEHQQSVCRENKNKKVVTVTKGEIVNITNEDDLLKLLYSYGPLSVGLDASDFIQYHGGILAPHACSSSIEPLPGRGHAVLLVGYGEENGMKFWIIKNSWGTKWGEKGYLRLKRGVHACGIGTFYTAKAEVA